MIEKETIPVEVTEAELITPLIRRFRLAPRGGACLPAFSGGSHVVVVIRHAGGVRRNAYSLMGDPGDRGSYQISVRKHETSRGGSTYLHDHATVGTCLEISPPVNLFPLAKVARKHILIAGGVGITPFIPQLIELKAAAADYELHYAARSLEHAAYARRLFAEHPGRVSLYLSAEGTRLDPLLVLSNQPLGTHAYGCGPEGLIDAVAAAAAAAGWPAGRVHRERFTVPAPGRPFLALLASSGRSVEVGEEVSLLEALEAQGLRPPFLCRGGVCGACETAVLDGKVDHADHVLDAETKATHRKIMICVSRSRHDRIVLDM